MENLQLAKFDAPGAIESVKIKVAPFAGLTISGMEDKAGYEAVRIALGTCVSTRTEFVDKCKGAREDATAYSKYVIEKEKEGVEAIKKVEDVLRAQKEKIDSEKERIKAERERKENEILQYRVSELAKYGCFPDISDMKEGTEEEFDALLLEKKLEWETIEKAKADKLAEEENARIAKEEADRLEREEFARQKAELEKAKAEQDRREAEILAKEKAIEDDRITKEREAEAERLTKVRAEEAERMRIAMEAKAKADAEARIKREAEEKEAREALDKAELEKKLKYKEWLSDNGYDATTDKPLKSDDGKSVILWRKISEFKI